MRVPGADLGDGVLDGAGREGQCADVNRDVVRLRHQPAVLVADRMEKSRLELRICE